MCRKARASYTAHTGPVRILTVNSNIFKAFEIYFRRQSTSVTKRHQQPYFWNCIITIPSPFVPVTKANISVCTFAYAVHRASALQILTTLSHEPPGGTTAFDVALLSSCRDRGWRCWSVNPELFHHADGQSEIFRADRNGMDGMQEGRSNGRARGTWNVGCGARLGQLWVDEWDELGRREVKALVRETLERGECLIDGLEEERGRKGCEWGECGAQS